MRIEQLQRNGYSKKDIAKILKARSAGGKKGGLKKVPKGLGAMSPERAREIQLMGNKASIETRRLKKMDVLDDVIEPEEINDFNSPFPFDPDPEEAPF